MFCATNECDTGSKKIDVFYENGWLAEKKNKCDTNKNVTNGLDYKGGLQYLKESCCNIFATCWSLLFKYGNLRNVFLEIWLLWHFFL
jgi:hypothetical protein